MKAEEFRIGNYIDVNSVVYKVVGIDLEGVMTEPLISFEHLIDMDRNNTTQPIPLTEEWLVKFGFDEIEVEGYPMYVTNKGLFIEYYKNESVFIMSDFEVHIKHVHQLQNLYYALTGEELTIKE